MAYTKNKWAVYNPNLEDDDQPDAFITKSKLDHMEEGIEEAHNNKTENENTEAKKETVTVYVGYYHVGEDGEVIEDDPNPTVTEGEHRVLYAFKEKELVNKFSADELLELVENNDVVIENVTFGFPNQSKSLMYFNTNGYTQIAFMLQDYAYDAKLGVCIYAAVSKEKVIDQ